MEGGKGPICCFLKLSVAVVDWSSPLHLLLLAEELDILIVMVFLRGGLYVSNSIIRLHRNRVA